MSTTTFIIQEEEEKNVEYYIQIVCSTCNSTNKEDFMKDPRTGDILCLTCFQVCTEEKIIDSHDSAFNDCLIQATVDDNATPRAITTNGKECINIYCLNKIESLFVSKEKDGDIICTLCGTSQIIGSSGLISEKPDWNNYSSEQNQSRVGYFDHSNPYYTLGTKIDTRKSKIKNGVDKNGNERIIDLSKLQYNLSSTNSSKEQSFNKVIRYFDQFKTDINPRVLDRAKIIWDKVNKKFPNHHRGKIRKGLFCNCIVQAGIELSSQSMFRGKNDIKEILGISDTDFLRAEKIFKGYNLIDTSTDEETPKQKKKQQIRSIFENIIHKLKLEYSLLSKCIEIYEKCTVVPRLTDIRLKTLVATIITMVAPQGAITITEIAIQTKITIQTITKTKRLILKYL